jgi:predicted AAA+ superfamily ATPase
VGAHLANGAAGTGIEVFYWRERGREVDFVLRHGRTLVAIEVKSGRAPESLPGMEAFVRAHRRARRLLVGGDGIPLEEFLASPVTRWLAE